MYIYKNSMLIIQIFNIFFSFACVFTMTRVINVYECIKWIDATETINFKLNVYMGYGMISIWYIYSLLYEIIKITF